MGLWGTLNHPLWLYHTHPSHRDQIPAFLLRFFKITKEHPGRSFFCPYLHRFPIHNYLNIPQDTYHEFLRISTTVRTIILLRQVLQISFPLLNHKYTKNSRYIIHGILWVFVILNLHSVLIILLLLLDLFDPFQGIHIFDLFGKKLVVEASYEDRKDLQWGVDLIAFVGVWGVVVDY